MVSDKRTCPESVSGSQTAYALITGGSSGIGLQYARQLAEDYHYNLLIVSNQEQELLRLRDELKSAYSVQVHTLYLNLAQNDAAEQVFRYVQQHQLDVHVLVNNAGFLIFDAFTRVPVEKIEAIILLHVLTLTKLCRLFADLWQQQTRSSTRRFILNMSSMSAWMAMPSIQCYNATKGYVLNFSRALWYELRQHNIRVLAVTPGATDTGLLPFPAPFAKLLRTVGISMSPQCLVRKVLKTLFTSWRKTTMPGPWNHLIVPIINHLPDWIVFTAMKRLPMFQ